jgi:tetratricopeptide (TPR) repeat protein
LGLAKILYNWAEHHKKRNRLEEAEAAYQRVADILGKPIYAQQSSVVGFLADSHTNLGELRVSKGDFVEAIESYRTAWEIQEKLAQDHPDLPDSNDRLAQARSDLGRILANCPEVGLRQPRRALQLVEQAIQLAPDDEDILTALVIAQYRAGEWSAAVETLDKLTRIHSGSNSFDQLLLAMAHWQLGETDKSNQLYNQAVESMEDGEATNDELRRLRTEAAELLAVERDLGQNEESDK